VEICLEKWSVINFLGNEEQIVHTYTSLVFALQYCLPLLVLLVTYTFIGIKMWNSKVPGEQASTSTSTASSGAQQVQQQRHRLSSVSSVNVKGETTVGGGPHHGQSQNHRAFMNKQLDRRHESVKKVGHLTFCPSLTTHNFKLIPMVLLVSALYAGCWLPQNLLMNIWVTYNPSITSHPYILYIW